MLCSVYDCKNKSWCNNTEIEKLISFHAFPNNPSILKIWISFCKRKNTFSTKTARICSEHFLKEDFENILKYEMGFSDKLILKKGVVPSVYGKSITNISDRSKRLVTRTRKRIVSLLLAESNTSVIKETDDVDVETENINEISKMEMEIADLKSEMEILKTENDRIEKVEDKYKYEIDNLKRELKKSQYHLTNIENRLMEIFTPGQIRKLKNGSKRIQWSEDDIKKSISLYSASPRAYKLLQRKQFPLPCVRTLYIRAKTIDISSDIIDPVLFRLSKVIRNKSVKSGTKLKKKSLISTKTDLPS